MVGSVKPARGKIKFAATRERKKSPNGNSAYIDLLEKITKHLTLALQCGAISTAVGVLVIHYYLNTIGFENLFIEVVGSQGGLIAILVSFFGFGFIGFLMVTLGPLFFWLAKHYFFATGLAQEVLTGPPLCRLIVISHCSIVLIAFFLKNSWLYAVFLFFPLFFLFLRPGIRKLFVEVKTGSMSWWECTFTFAKYYGVIAYSLGWCVVPWVLILSFIQRLLNGTAYQDSDLVGFGLSIVASIILGLISILIIDSRKLGERRKGLSIFVSIAIVLSMLSMFVIQDFYIWVRGGLIGAGVIERSEVRRWYQIKKEAYGELHVSDHKRFVKTDIEGHHYMCANSPFTYVQTKILCDPGIEKPNQQQCVAFDSKEARAVGLPLDGNWNCPSK